MINLEIKKEYNKNFRIALFLLTFFLFPFVCSYLLLLIFVIKEEERFFVTFSILVFLSLILASRPQDSGSTYHQINAFLNIDSLVDVQENVREKIASNDLFFWYISYLIKLLIDENYILFIWFWAFFSLLSIQWSFKQILHDTWTVAFVIYYSSLTFYFISGTTIRQSAALGLFMMAIAFMHNKKKFKALLMSLCAAFSHISCYMFLPFFFMNYIRKPNIKILSCFLLFSLIFSYINVLKYINMPFFPELIKEKIYSYSIVESGSFLSRQFFFSVFIILILYSFNKKKLINLNKYYLLICAYLYVFGLQVLFKISFVYWDRLAAYKNILQIIILIIVLNEFNEKKTIHIFIIIICFFYNLFLLSNPFISYLNRSGLTIINKNLFDLLEIINNLYATFYRKPI